MEVVSTITGPEDEQVIALTAHDVVVAGAGIDRIVASPAIDHIVTITAVYLIITFTAEQRIRNTAATDIVITVLARNQIVAGGTSQRIASAGTSCAGIEAITANINLDRLNHRAGITTFVSHSGTHRHGEIIGVRRHRQGQAIQVALVHGPSAVTVISTRRQLCAIRDTFDGNRHGFRTIRIGKSSGDINRILDTIAALVGIHDILHAIVKESLNITGRQLLIINSNVIHMAVKIILQVVRCIIATGPLISTEGPRVLIAGQPICPVIVRSHQFTIEIYIGAILAPSHRDLIPFVGTHTTTREIGLVVLTLHPHPQGTVLDKQPEVSTVVIP